MAFKHIHVIIDEDLWERKDPERTWKDTIEAGIKSFEPWVGQKRCAGIKPKYMGHPDAGFEEPQYERWNGKEWVAD